VLLETTCAHSHGDAEISETTARGAVRALAAVQVRRAKVDRQAQRRVDAQQALLVPRLLWKLK